MKLSRLRVSLPNVSNSFSPVMSECVSALVRGTASYLILLELHFPPELFSSPCDVTNFKGLKLEMLETLIFRGFVRAEMLAMFKTASVIEVDLSETSKLTIAELEMLPH
eukprot:PhF_6_TR22353/c0_g1_i2/m.31662